MPAGPTGPSGIVPPKLVTRTSIGTTAGDPVALACVASYVTGCRPSPGPGPPCHCEGHGGDWRRAANVPALDLLKLGRHASRADRMVPTTSPARLDGNPDGRSSRRLAPEVGHTTRVPAGSSCSCGKTSSTQTSCLNAEAIFPRTARREGRSLFPRVESTLARWPGPRHPAPDSASPRTRRFASVVVGLPSSVLAQGCL